MLRKRRMPLHPMESSVLNGVVLLVIGFLCCFPARSNTLDDLFSSDQFSAFFAQAHTAADQGNPDALFLLGKAYHLGKGVAANEDTARDYYERARAAGSARASHNLGMLELGLGNRSRAIVLLEEALARGLKMPTLYNLGRAHSPPDAAGWPDAEDVHSALRAGGYFAQANTLRPSVDSVFNASREYLRAYHFAQRVLPPHNEGFDLFLLRGQAAEWLLKGTALDHGPSWTNYGAFLLGEGDHEGAYAAFEEGAKQDVAVAHHHLARMLQRGYVRVGDTEKALFHHERAAQLGLEASRLPARDLLLERLRAEFDMDVLEEGIRRLDALHREGDFADVVSPRTRLAWGRFVESNRLAAGRLPRGTIALRACGLRPDEPHGEAYGIRYNSVWRLVIYSTHEGAESYGIVGRVRKDGCAVAKALPAQTRRLLEEGAVPALQFPSSTLPLRWRESVKGVDLVLQPLGTPTPPL